MVRSRWVGWSLLLLWGAGQMVPVAQSSSALPEAASGQTAGVLTYTRQIKPLLEQYCYACHGNGKSKGDLALDVFESVDSIRKDLKTWQTVLHHVRTGEMPPKNKPQPSPVQRDLIALWIESEVFQCDCEHPDPGRVTIRRLNRVEYNHTIHDLVGIDFEPAADFPADDIGYGFDNIGDVLSLPPILLEKYLAAAEKILNAALKTNLPPNYPIRRFKAGELESSAPGGTYGQGARLLAREGEVTTKFSFASDGEYIFRLHAFGQQAGPEPARMDFQIDSQVVRIFDVAAVENAPKTYEVQLAVKAGERCLSAGYINNYVNPKDPDPNNRDRNLILEYLEVAGPVVPAEDELPAVYQRLVFCRPTGPAEKEECAHQVVERFASRAFRRPITEDENRRLLNLFRMAHDDGASFEQALKVPLEAVLISPHFLFRGALQPSPDDPDAVHPVDEMSLASRLSYFLWSTMPDDELLTEARHGSLREHLHAQVRRMLRDPKAHALVDNFALQWLQVRSLKTAAPDAHQFPAFDDELRAAMEHETELFCAAIINENRSVLEFLDANYTFLNERLARHYGISGVKGPQFQRISLEGSQRGGVLSQASILTITSNPTRTSPVKRGKWVLDNLLGAPPPPPPPDVPELKTGNELTGTLRQRMEQHRDNPLCASCHARMDPIGFGLENFDAIGAWRSKDGANPVDPAGQLVTGESFSGPSDLRRTLATAKREDFLRCLTEKLLTYALGRGIEFYDKCATDRIIKALRDHQFKFSSLVIAIVESAPFQLQRGEKSEGRNPASEIDPKSELRNPR